MTNVIIYYYILFGVACFFFLLTHGLAIELCSFLDVMDVYQTVNLDELF